MIIDTHVHLNDEIYQEKLEEVITEAKINNVCKMIVIGYNKASSYKAVEIANTYDDVYAAIGIHPSDVLKEDRDLSWIEELAKNRKVIAIGEIGLDYYWSKNDIDLQKEFFIDQLKIASKLNLPVSIHSRDAYFDTLEILKNNPIKGVLHCYSGSVEIAKELTKLGFYLGIGGVVTFKNSRVIKEVVSEIDLKYLVTETDSPYLTPVPYRGKPNQPSYVKYVLEEIARIKNKSLGEVERIIEGNVKKLFNI